MLYSHVLPQSADSGSVADHFFTQLKTFNRVWSVLTNACHVMLFSLYQFECTASWLLKSAVSAMSLNLVEWMAFVCRTRQFTAILRCVPFVQNYGAAQIRHSQIHAAATKCSVPFAF